MAIPDIKQVITAVYTKLNADTTLKALTGDNAIYSGINVKATAARPYVLIRPPQGFEDIGSKNYNMWRLGIEILIVTAETESSNTLETMIDYIMEDLHRATLSTTSTHIRTVCTGMIQIPSSDQLAASVLQFDVVIAE